ncbi:hypothetical protein C2845_PM08G01550, partial [Panicum miliaceum]
PFHTWEQKVVLILHEVRCREFTQRNLKTGVCEPCRFSLYNIAFFDFDKESEVVHGPLFRDITPSGYERLDTSFNVISIKVAESDVRYPIHIYGTVLTRDKNDYRCVYLFKRGRDEPQIITRKKRFCPYLKSEPGPKILKLQNRMLALTGPYRALGGTSHMYFEFDLKIRGEEAVDEDFNKGLLELHAFMHTFGVPCTSSLQSYPRTVDMVCVPVHQALEASIGVNFLNGKSTFAGKIFASTSESDTSKLVMYDSQVPGTKTEFGSDGSVSSSRHV